MDAVEFLKTLCRMCNCECYNCEFKKRLSGFETCTVWRKTHPEEAVAIVEKWAKEHPIKTRQSEFLKQYPEARIDKATGVLTICPAELTKECRDDRGACGAYSVETCVCEPYRREFWLAEVEE